MSDPTQGGNVSRPRKATVRIDHEMTPEHKAEHARDSLVAELYSEGYDKNIRTLDAAVERAHHTAAQAAVDVGTEKLKERVRMEPSHPRQKKP